MHNRSIRCGKTTLLNLISGLDKKLDGEIIFEKKKNQRHANSLYVSEPRLLPWLTVLENVEVILSKEQKNLVELKKF